MRAVPVLGTSVVHAGWVYRVGIPGWVTGWVYREGYTGTQPAARGGLQIQRSGPPEALQGLEWGGIWRPDARGALQVRTTPAGPGRSLWALPVRTLRFAASWPIKARFDLISLKVSQNHGVSPKYVKKASHSPYIQNGLGKSPLEFPRFPFMPAFSHKELMAPF